MDKEQYAILISVLQEISFGIKTIVQNREDCPGSYRSDKLKCTNFCPYAVVCLRDSRNENIQD